MASGIINVTTNNKYISGKISWSSTTNIEGNYSTVTATWKLSRTNTGYTTSGSGSFTLNIGGNSKTNSGSFTFTYNSNTVVCTHTAKIYHNSDGSKSITITASGSHDRFSVNTASGTAKLDTIPRTSVPTLSDSSVNYGSAVTIYTNRASTSFSHTLRYDWNGRTGTIASGVGDNCAWTVPNSFMNYIPNAASSWGTIFCDTYSGGTFIGTKTVKLTTSVPSGIVPSLSSISASDITSTYGSVSVYVQNLSRIRFQINGASGTYSSSITGYEIVFDGRTYGSSNVTITPTKAGTFSATARVRDSRGRWSSSKSMSVTISGYSVPKITEFSTIRCNSDGTANNMGTYVKVTRKGSWNNFGGKNTASWNIKSKPKTSSTWTTIKTESDTDGAFDFSFIFDGYSEISSYDFLFTVSDKFNTTTATATVPTGAVPMSWGKTGIGAGKVWERGALDVGGNAYIDGNLIVNKNGTTSTITFPAQTNDPAFIQHIENNNIAEMRFSASDDRGATDFFSFGSSSSGAYSEGARIYTEGTAQFDGTVTATAFNPGAGVFDGGKVELRWNGGTPFIDFSNDLSVDYNARIMLSSDNVLDVKDAVLNCAQGVHGVGRSPAYTWSGTINANAGVTITHNLGYEPLIMVDGTCGSLSLTFSLSNTTQAYVWNWSGGGANWSGTLKFY